ncbi:MAG: superoxide dismutase family protein [Planctomycetes bacterium]|nr:superoxide dismutase family protein [Planctomycetota bacterium]
MRKSGRKRQENKLGFAQGLLFCATLLILFTISCSKTIAVADTPRIGIANIINSMGELIGGAFLTQDGDKVKIKIKVTKLPPGAHAFHINEIGVCNPPDFSSSGAHFNPFNKKHGLKSSEGSHAGDLPNLIVGQDGIVETEFNSTEITLSEGSNSIFDSDGSAFDIHANSDDETTDPSGNGGARIACGVITKHK